MDDKLGIFIHWGAYAVPAFDNEWYPRFMYRDEVSRKGPNYFQHHTQTWGHPSQFGYKDFIPLFKAEKWDPAQWVDLFRKAGARYIVPVAEHHDGFPMYASTHTRWNAARMGPKRDVCKELERETRADGVIPAQATQLLLELGAWLDVNGEAIYGTRHWEQFGEGDTAVEAGHMSERKNQPFTAKDVRFTQKDDALYAVVLGWPGDEAVISSLGGGSSVGGRIRGVSMLGSEEPVAWKQDENALTVSTPRQRPCDHAYTFKIELDARG